MYDEAWTTDDVVCRVIEWSKDIELVPGDTLVIRPSDKEGYLVFQHNGQEYKVRMTDAWCVEAMLGFCWTIHRNMSNGKHVHFKIISTDERIKRYLRPYSQTKKVDDEFDELMFSMFPEYQED